MRLSYAHVLEITVVVGTRTIQLANHVLVLLRCVLASASAVHGHSAGIRATEFLRALMFQIPCSGRGSEH